MKRKFIIDGIDHSRSICPFNRHDTNQRISSMYTGHQDCRHCSICIGRLSYSIWFDNLRIEGSLEVLNDKYQDLEFKEVVSSHLKEERKSLKENLELVKQIRF